MSLVRMEGNVTVDSQAKRLRYGVFMFAIAMLIGIVMVKSGVGPVYRAMLLVPFWIAGNGFFSALYKT
jgi:hypothetical protein